jgi:hypothetical protein
VVVEQVGHLILVPMVEEVAVAVVSVTFHPSIFLLMLHSQLQLVMEERVVIHILHHPPVDLRLNQEVVEQAQYLIHLVAVAYLPLLQLVVVAAVAVVLPVAPVDRVVVNHIQEMVDLEILEGTNQEQIL